MIAVNRCCKCRHEWNDRTSGFARYSDCPSCGSVYWEWLNVADFVPQATPEPRPEGLRLNATPDLGKA